MENPDLGQALAKNGVDPKHRNREDWTETSSKRRGKVQQKDINAF